MYGVVPKTKLQKSSNLLGNKSKNRSIFNSTNIRSVELLLVFGVLALKRNFIKDDWNARLDAQADFACIFALCFVAIA